MLKKRPFTLFLRHSRKLDRFYNRLEYKYEGEVQLEDTSSLNELLTQYDEKLCELDIRFTKVGLEDFGFDRLKDFDDEAKRIKQTKEDDGPI